MNGKPKPNPRFVTPEELLAAAREHETNESRLNDTERAELEKARTELKKKRDDLEEEPDKRTAARRDRDVQLGPQLNAHLALGRRLKGAVYRLASETGISAATLWQEATHADSMNWGQAIVMAHNGDDIRHLWVEIARHQKLESDAKTNPDEVSDDEFLTPEQIAKIVGRSKESVAATLWKWRTNAEHRDARSKEWKNIQDVDKLKRKTDIPAYRWGAVKQLFEKSPD